MLIFIFSEPFPGQIDCGEELIILMSIILPFFFVFSLLMCWIIRPYPQQASNVIEYRITQS